MIQPPRCNIDQLRDGNRFRDFCNNLLSYEISSLVEPYAKEGTDFKIDARYSGPYQSHDGIWVFQYKWRSGYSDLKQALRDDVAGVCCIRAGGRGESGIALWRSVDRFVVLTNSRLSPQQKLECCRILDDLPEGIKADIWDGERLRTLAERHPGLLVLYWGTTAPAFCTLREWKAILASAPLGEYYHDIPYQDGAEASRIVATIADPAGPRAILVSGPSKVGKTRCLVECGQRLDDGTRDVLHALPVESYAGQFGLLRPDRESVLIVDGAEQYRLESLLSFAAHNRAYRIRFLVSCQGTSAQAVQDRILGHYTRTGEVEIIALSPSEQKSMALATAIGYERTVAESMERLSDGLPGWMVLIHDALKQGQNIADISKSEVLGALARSLLPKDGQDVIEKSRDTIQLISALRPLHTDDPELMNRAARYLHVDTAGLEKHIADLRDAGCVKLAGKTVSVVPDVVADFWLQHLLFDADSKPTGSHRALIDAFRDQLPHELVSNLARAEFLSGGSVLDALLRELVSEMRSADNFARKRTIESCQALAFFRPEQYLDLVRMVLEYPRDADTKEVLPGWPTETTQSDVVRCIPNRLRVCGMRPDQVRTTLLVLARMDSMYPRATWDAGASPTEVCRTVLGFRRSIVPGVYANACTLACQILARAAGSQDPVMDAQFRFALNAIESLMRLEIDESEWHGDTITIYRGPLELERVSGWLYDIRRACLEALKRPLTTGTSLQRVSVVECISVVIGNAYRWFCETKRQPTDLSSRRSRCKQDGVHFLWYQLIDCVAMLKERAMADSSHEVLLSIDRAVDWLIEADTGLPQMQQKAADVWNATTAQAGHTLYRVLSGYSRSHGSDANSIDELVDRLGTDAAFAELEVLASELPDGAIYPGLSHILFLMGKRYPELSWQRLLSVDSACDSGRGLARYWGYLLGGIRLAKGAEFAVQMNHIAGPLADSWVVDAYSWLHPNELGVSLTQEDLHVFESATARLHTTAHRVQAVRTAPAFRSVAPKKAIRILCTLFDATDSMLIGEIASVLDRGLSDGWIRPSYLDVKRLVLRFSEVRDLDLRGTASYYVSDVLARLTTIAPNVILDLYDARIEASQEDGSNMYLPFPHGLRQAYSRHVLPGAILGRFLRRIYTWSSRGGTVRFYATQLFESIITLDNLAAAVRWVRREIKDDSADLHALSAICAKLPDNPAAIMLKADISDLADQLPPDERDRIIDRFVGGVFDGEMSGTVGKVPSRWQEKLKAYERLLEDRPEGGAGRMARCCLAATRSRIDGFLDAGLE